MNIEPPKGWIPLDGRVLSKDDYPLLYTSLRDAQRRERRRRIIDAAWWLLGGALFVVLCVLSAAMS